MAWLDDHEHVAQDPGGVDIRRPGGAVTDGFPDPEPDWRLAGAPRFDLEQATDSDLIDLISRGSVPAFVALFDGTADVVRAELAHDLPGTTTRINEILAATYLEVWWLAGCHRKVPADVPGWITGIARRRFAEASRGTAWCAGHTALENPRPSYAELEIATLLRRPVDRLLQT